MAYQSEIEKLQRRYEEKPEQWFAAYADAYRKAGELDVALEIVRSGIEERPNYVSGYIVLGRCLVDQGKDSEAQEAFEQVLALDAENIIALSNLGEVSERAGDVTGARRWLERLLEVDPMNDKARHSLERLASMTPSPVVEAVEEAPASVEAPPDQPATEEPSPAEAFREVVEAFQEEEEAAPSQAEPPAIEAAAEPEGEPWAVPEPTFGEALGSSDRLAPTEPGPDLVSADEEPPSQRDEEDVSSVFGAPSTEPEVPQRDEVRDRSQFFIERQSDPFETPSKAKEAEQDAAALWASLGEDPELESVPDAESTSSSDAPSSEMGGTEEPSEIAAFGELDAPEEETPEPEPLELSDVPAAPPFGGTTQMSVADLNALVEREREEAQERDRAAAHDDVSGEPAVEAEEKGEEFIGGPPPEYQLERPEPRGASDSVPLFSDPDLLAGESLDEDVATSEEPSAPSAAEPVDEPEPVMQSASEPDVAAEYKGGASDEYDRSAPATHAEETDDVVTETMAEVYAAQGLFAEAKEVYRKLLERRPGDADVEERLAAIEAREREAARIEVGAAAAAPAKAPSREYAASRTGGVPARTFLAEMLGERPRAVPVESISEPPAPTTVLDETFASDRPDSQGHATRPAADEMSLASVFGDRTPDTGEHRRPSTEQVAPPPPPSNSPPQPSPDDLDLSFDSFFSSGAEDTGAAPPEEDAEGDDDDEDFKAWLKSLKS